MELAKNKEPGAVGTFIMVRKTVFDDLNGFDETVALGEDYDIASRSFKKGYKYHLLKDPPVYFSVRRLNEEGRWHFATKCMRAGIYYLTHGSIRDPNKFDWEFGKHD